MEHSNTSPAANSTCCASSPAANSTFEDCFGRFAFTAALLHLQSDTTLQHCFENQAAHQRCKHWRNHKFAVHHPASLELSYDRCSRPGSLQAADGCFNHVSDALQVVICVHETASVRASWQCTMAHRFVVLWTKQVGQQPTSYFERANTRLKIRVRLMSY